MYSDRTLKSLVTTKQQDYLNDAERYRLLRKGHMTWRYRAAENLIGLASRLSPDHRGLLHSLGKSQSTMMSETFAVGNAKPC